MFAFESGKYCRIHKSFTIIHRWMPPCGENVFASFFPSEKRGSFSIWSLMWYATRSRRKLCGSKAGVMIETYTVKEIIKAGL